MTTNHEDFDLTPDTEGVLGDVGINDSALAVPVNEDDSVGEPVAFTPDQPKVNFETQRPIAEPLPADKIPELTEVIALFRESANTVKKLVDLNAELLARQTFAEELLAKDLAAKGKVPTDAEGNAWLRLLYGAIANFGLGNEGQRALERPDAQWAQVVEYESKELRPGVPTQRLSAGNYTPEELLAYVTRKAGVGITRDFPMWHSGLWFRLQSPSLEDFTTLNYEINNVKVEVGSETKGLSFSNHAHAMRNIAVNFALRFVIAANVNYRTPSDLRVKLSALDEPTLLLALASTIYANGFAYAAPCVADMANCQTIVREQLNLQHMLWVDTNSITREQRKHMSTRFNHKYSDEDLKRYRDAGVRGSERIVWFGDIGVKLNVPTSLDQELAGRAWIDDMVEMTQGAFNEPPHGTNRNQYIKEIARSTSARQYAHWISAVVERSDEDTDGYRLITDQTEAVTGMLSKVFSEEQYVQDFTTAVQQYIDDCLVAMVGVNSYNCPNCHTPIAQKFHERFEHIVAVDPLVVFFILVARKLNQRQS